MLTREQAVSEFPKLQEFSDAIEGIDSDIDKCKSDLPDLAKALQSIKRILLLHKNVAFQVATRRAFISFEAKQHLSDAIDSIIEASTHYAKAQTVDVAKKMAGV